MGSSADFSLRGARMPCCVVKRKVAPRESHLFVVAVDGSERAHSGLQLTEQLAMPGDRIVIVHVVVSRMDSFVKYLGGASVAGANAIQALHNRLAGRPALLSCTADRATYSAVLPQALSQEHLRTMACAITSGPRHATHITQQSFQKRHRDCAVQTASLCSYCSASPPLPSARVAALLLWLHRMQEGTSEATADGGAGSARLPTDSAVSERYTAYAAAAGSEAGAGESPRPKITCERLARTLAGTVADVLINYAEEHEADFLVVGADGLGRYAAGKSDHLGSTSDAVVRKSRTNVVVVQNPGAVF